MRQFVQRESIDLFGRDLSRHFYDFSCVCESSSGGFSFEEVEVGPIRIAMLSGCGFEVRRSWSQIRRSASNLYVFRFPIEGAVWVYQGASRRRVEIGPGQFTITAGNKPLQSGTIASTEGGCRLLSVLVPSHALTSMLPVVDKLCGEVFSAEVGEASFARDCFSLLFRDVDKMSPSLAEQAGMVALTGLTNSMKQDMPNVRLPHHEGDEHIERVFGYLDQHFSVPGLTATKVAEACGISRRYLHFLMKSRATAFAKELWGRRLDQANQWLADPAFEDRDIAEIAFMSGFGSPTHFSYLYKQHFGVTPRDARIGANTVG